MTVTLLNVDKTRALQQYATEIRALKGQTAELLLRIGQKLLAARKMARGPQWARFLLEADVSQVTARRFMRLAEAFGDQLPNLPVGRLDDMVKALGRKEDRTAFLQSGDLAALPPAEFEARLKQYKARAETAESRLATVEGALVDAPAKVIEANIALRRVDAAIAQCLECLEAAKKLAGVDLAESVDSGVVKSIRKRSEELFLILAPVK